MVLRPLVIGALCAAPILSCGGARSASQREPVPATSARVEAPPRTTAPAASAAEPEPEATPSDATLEPSGAHDAALDERYAFHGVAFHALAQVFEKPDASSFVIGNVRRGTSVRASGPVKGSGCGNTWHELWTGGYVCRGRGFQLGKSPQTFTPSPAPAALFDPLPYPYAKSIAPSSLQFFRIPTQEEQREAEAAYAALLASEGDEARTAPPAPPEPGAPSTAELPFPQLVRMPMAPGFYVSVDGVESDGERSFARTVRGGFVEQKTLAEVALPKAAGGPIGREERFPFGLVYRDGAKLIQRDTSSGALGASEPLPRYARVALLEGQAAARALPGYHLTRSGHMVADAKLRIPPRVVRPPVVPKNARLIHVHLATQTLVAYDGERPVYATLVSSGKEGFETPVGLYRIHAKHVSATMDGLAGEEDEYSIEDVPWTLYFQGSFALHAAFWHDKFGNTRSHGCVNLSPADARWLFEWSTPTLPAGFHNAMATRDNPGTYVLID
jgi:hypothetical protein